MVGTVRDAADRLERSQWDLFWVPEDAVVHDRPELLYVSCPHDLPHLNAVTRTDPTHPDLDALVGEGRRAHAAVRSRWSVPLRIADDRLHGALERGGYEPKSEHDGRAIETGAFVPRPASKCEVVKWVGLYAVMTTSSPIVRRQGFGRFGTMTYWERAPEP